MADKILFVQSAFKHGYIQEDIGVTMRDMTDEEYDALDEHLTKTVPKLGPNGTGFFSRKGLQVVVLDENTAKILNAKAIATRQTPSEIIASMLRKDLTITNTQI